VLSNLAYLSNLRSKIKKTLSPGCWLGAIQPVFNVAPAAESENQGSAQNVPFVRFKLIEPIFLFELSPLLFQNRVELEKN